MRQVWLSGRGGCTPAGSYSKTVTVGGKSWKLWTGTVQEWQIVRFFAGPGSEHWLTFIRTRPRLLRLMRLQTMMET